MTRALAYNDAGLVPAIAQDVATGEILMVAWMNAEALERTRATGFAHFYSRSRQALWKKGETSGNTLAVRALHTDCDADTVLLLVEPTGPACHTGERSCFFEAGGGGPGGSVVDRIAAVARARRDSATADKSYTKSLLDGGFPKILAKIAEEHGELAAELPAGDRDAVIHETADLLFHVIVGLVARDIEPAEVMRALARRFGTSGHVEKASRS